jgi:hypothetical protein
MSEIPRQVSKGVRKAIKSLRCNWEIVKKRDHYFLLARGRRIVVANNSSPEKKNRFLESRTIQEIRGIDGEVGS